MNTDLERYIHSCPETVRLDRWLMAARFFKTRSQAVQACTGGKIKVNGVTAKPGKMVRPGDELVVQHKNRYRNVRIRYLAQRGLPATVAKELYEEEEPVRLNDSDRELMRFQRELEKRVKRKFKGRPTKKERRDWQKMDPTSEENV